MSDAKSTERLDKWLWHARFFKTRSLASRLVSGGLVRVNGERVVKPATPVRLGYGLTFPQGRDIRIVRVQAFAARRGPAAEARALYLDLAPRSEEKTKPPPPVSETKGQGRPTKKWRRALDALRRFET